MKNTTTEIVLKELWEILHQKFSVDYNNDFSNKDVDGWLKHFVPNQKIDVYQYGKDVTGKKGTGKTIKIYTGNIFSSLINGRIPAKMMAKIVFKRLSQQNYSHSETILLGIQESMQNENQTSVYFRYKRFNTSGEMYEIGLGIYGLTKIENNWLINEMALYDDNDEISSKVDLSEMWHPGNI